MDLVYNVKTDKTVKLVLEASEDDNQWRKIYKIACDLVDSLPGRAEEIFFMGSGRKYSFTSTIDFKTKLPDWYQDSRGCITLLRPFFDFVNKTGYKGVICVVCSVPPVDIDDWIDTPLLKQVVFLNVSENPFGYACKNYSCFAVTASTTQKLANQVTGVYISSADFVPLSFNIISSGKNLTGNVKYNEQETAFLLEAPAVDNLEIHLRAFCAEKPSLSVETELNAYLIPASVENNYFGAGDFQKMDEGTFNIVSSSIKGQEFLCPYCGLKHKPGVSVCPSGGIILRAFSIDSVILFKADTFCDLSSRFAFLYHSNNSLVTKDGLIYDFNGKWKFINDLKQQNDYQQLDTDLWALYHRI